MNTVLLCVVVLVGCIKSSSEVCSDGSVCPSGTVCEAHSLCVLPDQLSACNGKAEGDACSAGAVSGHCLGGSCLASRCGDGVVEFGEMCDPTDGTECSADCTSDLLCGNGIIDISKGETCDDGGFMDNDGCSSTCVVEQPHWIRHTLTPGGRSRVGMAYDVRRGRVVGFGGFGGGTAAGGNADTLEWTGADWVFPPARTSPPARNGAGVIYDSARNQVVMFGGFDGVFSQHDTWIWDGNDWRGADAVGPDPRSNHTFTYDPVRKVGVVFGGYGNEDGDHDDTYEWNGTTWTHVATAVAPPKREDQAVAFDPKHGVLVLVGGTDIGTSTMYADTWTYDGAWHNVTPPGGAPKSVGGALAWDPASQKLILFGGSINYTASTQVWAWDGAGWTALANAPTGVGPRESHSAVTMGTKILVFGGSDGNSADPLLGDTWFYSNGTWTQPANLGARTDGRSFNDVSRREAIVTGGRPSAQTLTPSAETWGVTTNGFGLLAGAPPSARNGQCVAWDPVHHNAVMFGGTTYNSGTVAYGDTWVWSGTGWMQKTPAHAPPARYNAACAYDGANVTMIGGTNNTFGIVPDAWSWDGTDWTDVTASLPADLVQREEAIAAYDPKHAVMVIQGGKPMFGSYDSATWTYDGVAKAAALVGNGFTPNGRQGASLVWNPAREQLVLAGGVSVGTDSYEWDGAAWHPLDAGVIPPARADHEAWSSLDGGGTVIYGGSGGSSYATDSWELRWEGPLPHEQCDGTDNDKDGLVGCADPDCWAICSPMCLPGASCDPAATPNCGDGICDSPRENGRTCPKDCPVTPVCGDGICDPSESCPGDCT